MLLYWAIARVPYKHTYIPKLFESFTLWLLYYVRIVHRLRIYSQRVKEWKKTKKELDRICGDKRRGTVRGETTGAATGGDEKWSSGKTEVVIE